MFMKRKVITLLLSLAMILSFMPGIVFADDGDDDNQEPLIAQEELESDAAEAEAAEDAVLETADPEEPQANLSAELAQTKLNYKNVKVTVADFESILANGDADSIKIDASMSYDGTVTLQEETILKLADFDTSTKSAEFELPYFGKYDISVLFMKDGAVVGESVKSSLALAAEEYNIAALAATTDVLIFSLRHFDTATEHLKTEGGDPIPTIVTLNRYKQYDWDKLPSDMYRNPLLTEKQNYSAMNWDTVQKPNNKMDRMQQYVKELNEIHPGSKFNFYINDYQLYTFPRLSFANGLKDDQYTLTMITDGSGSYTAFKEAYEGKADAQAEHDKLVTEYQTFKGQAAAGTVTDYNNLPSGLIRKYAYAIVEAEDAQWWVVRKSADTFGLSDTAFQSKLTSDARVKNSYINNLLKTVQENGSDEEFKALYKFEDSAFNATRAKGKKIMMILGTSKSLEDKYPVTDYVRFMTAYMGDEYEFYYKGHPGNYTANSEENVKKYREMGIQMLDPSIAGELFLFYNDDIYLCGYESSLFNNASSEKSEEQDVALFRRTLQTAKVDPALTAYADFMDFTISDMTDETDNFTYTYDEAWDEARPGMADAKAEAIAVRDKVKALVPAGEAADKNYLVQFNNNGEKTVSEYKYAIWNSDKALIHYITEAADGKLSIAKTEEAQEPGSYLYEVSAKQTALNYRNVTIQIPELAELKSAGIADEVKVEASMSYNGKVTEKSEFVQKLEDIDTTYNEFEVEMPYYGKYDLTVTFLKDGKTAGEVKTMTVGVAAEEYNIATPVGTTDPLIFSLRYFIEGAVKETTESGDPVPTIVTLNRFKQFDWDKLPENMFRNPLMSADENYSAMKWDSVQGNDNKIDRMTQYVKELNEIHPGSKFNFYINDFHIYSFPRMSYANGLTDDQYTLTLITDGSGSYTSFKEAYEGTDNAQAVHDQRVKEYNEFKEKAKAGEVTDFNNLPSGLIRTYGYAVVDAEDAQWWVVRKSTDTFGLTDTAFQAKVLADTRITNSYINSLLATVQGNGNEEAFKSLYKFDDEAFNATRAKGKKIMMILGTSKSIEDKYPVTDYVRFMVAEMGDEYEFYYKGHPGNYKANSEENVAKYEAMGIQMLDPSIAAELFLFYNDDIYLCGYESSLYNNASNEKSEEQDVGLFRRTLQTAKADPALTTYVDFMDFAISDMTDETDNFTYTYDEAWDAVRPGMAEAKAKAIEVRDRVKAIVPTGEESDRNYLVQYNNNDTKTVSQYDYAIWNSDKSRIHYIKETADGTLEIVDTKDAGGIAVGKSYKYKSNTYKITSIRDKTVAFTKAKNAKTITVPSTVVIKGEKYTVTSVAAKAFTAKKIRTVYIGKNVKSIAKYAFKSSKATKMYVKTKLLKKSAVKGSLKGSKIKTVQVKIGTKKTNRTYVKKYKKYFTKANAGKKVTVKY